MIPAPAAILNANALVFGIEMCCPHAFGAICDVVVIPTFSARGPCFGGFLR
jgi:hypothetical protein